MSTTLAPATRSFLAYLGANPGLRDAIRAPRDRTLLYAGSFFKPVWKELAELKGRDPALAGKVVLPDVLSRLPGPAGPGRSLLGHVQDLERQVPWKPDGFTVWRALSGIFASNAEGAVSFYVGSGVTKGDKVFAATELAVLERNPNVDALTKDVLAYFRRCIATHQSDVNFAYLSK